MLSHLMFLCFAVFNFQIDSLTNDCAFPCVFALFSLMLIPLLSTSTSSANNATTNVMASNNNAAEEDSSNSSLNASSLRPKGHTKSASVSGRSCASAYASELRPIDSNSTLNSVNETIRPRFDCMLY